MRVQKYVKGKRVIHERMHLLKNHRGYPHVKPFEMCEVLKVFSVDKDFLGRDLREVQRDVLQRAHVTKEEIREVS